MELHERLRLHDVPLQWSECLPTLQRWHQELTAREQELSRADIRLRWVRRSMAVLMFVSTALAAAVTFAALNARFQNVATPLQIALTTIVALPAVIAGLERCYDLPARAKCNRSLLFHSRRFRGELEALMTFTPGEPRTAISNWHKRYRRFCSRR